jgi:predicted short-subunit dehydrogenase-like oxidoreductase (DUF2520 family)
MRGRDRVTVFIYGAGKVGRALAASLLEKKTQVTLRAARRGFPRGGIEADVLVLAVRDRELPKAVSELLLGDVLSPRTAVVHVAGALSPEVLAPLRARCAGVAQMHPMISFASKTRFPSLTRGNMHVQGDRVATSRARLLARTLGMTPRTIPELDTVAYHAAAGLVANGAAALAAVGADILVAAGVDRKTAPKMLGPLLRSVADNIEILGFPDALTGPVRRGDAAAVHRAWELIASRVPYGADLYAAAVAAQLPLAEALGEAPASAWVELRAWARAHTR